MKINLLIAVALIFSAVSFGQDAKNTTKDGTKPVNAQVSVPHIFNYDFKLTPSEFEIQQLAKTKTHLKFNFESPLADKTINPYLNLKSFADDSGETIYILDESNLQIPAPNYMRMHCGYLEDGISMNTKSSDVILSNVADYLLNTNLKNLVFGR